MQRRQAICGLGSGGLLLALPPALAERATSMSAALSVAVLPRTLNACDDDAERPPYVYYQRRLGVKTEEPAGYSVDLLRRILEPHGIAFNLELLPWRRCLGSVQSGQHDLVITMSRGGEREQRFLFSRPIAQSRLVYFYDVERPLPKVDRREDLHRHRVCLVTGVNYLPFGLQIGDAAVTGQTKTLGQSFLMLKSRRCDLVPSRLDSAIGYRLLGMADYEQLGLAYRTVPGLAPQTLHFGVGARHPHGAALIELFDRGIERLQASGEMADLAERYGVSR